MSDRTYLDWPFLEERHRQLKGELDAWCEGRSFAHEQRAEFSFDFQHNIFALDSIPVCI